MDLPIRSIEAMADQRAEAVVRLGWVDKSLPKDVSYARKLTTQVESLENQISYFGERLNGEG